MTSEVQPAGHLYEPNEPYPQQLSTVRLWAAHKASRWGLQVGMCSGSAEGVLAHMVNPQFRGMGRTCIIVKYFDVTINPGFVW